jgi:uncharacterized protein (TIGR02118 family)
MAKMMVLYKTPKDPAAFDAYYLSTHVPIVKKIPGLKSFEITTGPIATATGPSDTYMIATLGFETMAALGAGLGGPEGQAASADVPNFAPDPSAVSVMMFDDKTV